MGEVLSAIDRQLSWWRGWVGQGSPLKMSF